MNERQPRAREAQFAGSIPEIYDSHLGPLLFQPYAQDLADRVTIPHGSSATALEVAAGSGILTAQLRMRFGRELQLAVTDVSARMLGVARARRERLGDPNVTWCVADGAALPFDDGAFDVVICQFGVMFFPDRERAAREARRVLRARGQWVFNVWGSLEENDFGLIVHDTVTRYVPDDPLRVANGPFGFSDPAALRDLVVHAGFADPEIVTVHVTVEAESAARAAVGFVHGSPLINAIKKHGATEPDTIVHAIADALTRAFGDHPVRIPTCARVVSAHRL